MTDRDAITMVEHLRATERERIREAAARLVEAECERVLALQKPDADPMSMDDTVNLNLRMTTVLLPNLAARIRALT